MVVKLPLSKLDINSIINETDANVSSKEKPQEVIALQLPKMQVNAKKNNYNLYDMIVNLNNNDKVEEQIITCETCNNCSNLQKKIDELEIKYHIYKLKDDDNNTITINIHMEEIYNGNPYIVTGNICCWWCCHMFDTMPIGLPDRLIEDIFYVIGYFCSFNCALAHNMTLNDHRMWERVSLLYLLRNRICKNMYVDKINNDEITKILGDIIVAAPKYILKNFGGSMNIEEYRAKSFILKKQYRTVLPQIISIPMQIEETVYNQDQNLLIKPNKPKVTKNDSIFVLKRNKTPMIKSSLL